MGKIIQSINITPDGFCDHTAAIADEELHRNAIEYLDNADAMLFGRVTYQLFERYWPEVAQKRTEPAFMIEFADRLNGMNKIVFSRSLKSIKWNKTTIIHELNRDIVVSLKNKLSGNILITGSINIADQLSQLGLIDEYHFQVQPMLGGRGHRLFEGGTLGRRIGLTLFDTVSFRSGVVVLKYKKE